MLETDTYLKKILNLSRRSIALIFSTALIGPIFYSFWLAYTAKYTTTYEISALLPDTAQGEVSKIYSTSPFNSMRLTFGPYEIFEEGTFIIKTSKNESEESVISRLKTQMKAFYSSRPSPRGQPIELNETEELAKLRSSLKIENENYNTLKNKYKNIFANASFAQLEKKILEIEAKIRKLENSVNTPKKPILSEPQITDVKKYDFTFNSKKFLLVSLLLGLCGMLVALISVLSLDKATFNLNQKQR